VFRFDRLSALSTGITLAQIGEFSFVLASEAHRGKILTEAQFDLLVTVTILSMFLAPYMAAYAVPFAIRIFSFFRMPPRPKSQVQSRTPTPNPAGHFFIIGFGPAGQRVADLLLKNCITATVVELNPKTASLASQKGMEVHMIDASNSEALSHIGIKGACLVIITVPDPKSAREIISNVRYFSPESMIIARSRYHIAAESLRLSGATVVVDEENTVGNELAEEVMKAFRQTDQSALGCALAGVNP
jgi:CPA2 family monovalent cation:H+ antiporter-2